MTPLTDLQKCTPENKYSMGKVDHWWSVSNIRAGINLSTIWPPVRWPGIGFIKGHHYCSHFLELQGPSSFWYLDHWAEITLCSHLSRPLMLCCNCVARHPGVSPVLGLTEAEYLWKFWPGGGSQWGESHSPWAQVVTLHGTNNWWSCCLHRAITWDCLV